MRTQNGQYLIQLFISSNAFPGGGYQYTPCSDDPFCYAHTPTPDLSYMQAKVVANTDTGMYHVQHPILLQYVTPLL